MLSDERWTVLGPLVEARAKRSVEVVHLGLEPWQALATGLDPEKVERSDRRAPVAASRPL